jgi:hypothetical protein
MASKQHEARSLMDEFLPNHDFSAAYEISIKSPASVVSECLLHLDIRTQPRSPRCVPANAAAIHYFCVRKRSRTCGPDVGTKLQPVSAATLCSAPARSGVVCEGPKSKGLRQ